MSKISKEVIRSLIAEGNTRRAISELLKYLPPESDEHQEVLQQSYLLSKYHNLKKSGEKISNSDNLIPNVVSNNLLDFLKNHKSDFFYYSIDDKMIIGTWRGETSKFKRVISFYNSGEYEDTIIVKGFLSFLTKRKFFSKGIWIVKEGDLLLNQRFIEDEVITVFAKNKMESVRVNIGTLIEKDYLMIGGVKLYK